MNAEQGEQPGTDEQKNDDIKPRHSIYLLWEGAQFAHKLARLLGENLQFLERDAIVQEPFAQVARDVIALSVPTHYMRLAVFIYRVIRHFILVE